MKSLCKSLSNNTNDTIYKISKNKIRNSINKVIYELEGNACVIKMIKIQCLNIISNTSEPQSFFSFFQNTYLLCCIDYQVVFLYFVLVFKYLTLKQIIISMNFV